MMSFHECGGNVGDDVCIPLPHWVAEIGRNNPDIFFTDREGRRNPECLSCGIDKERVLRGRTGVEVLHSNMNITVRDCLICFLFFIFCAICILVVVEVRLVHNLSRLCVCARTRFCI